MQTSTGRGPSVLAFWLLCALWIIAASAGNLSRRSTRRPATDREVYAAPETASQSRWTPATCRDSKDEAGRCAHLRDCLADEYGSNLTLAMRHACPILRTYVGTCCADRRGGAPEESAEERSLADLLPLIAADDHEGDGDAGESGSANGARIVWSDAEERPSTSRPRDPARPRGCGTTWRSRSKLVGGRPADPTEWPWMAALLRKDRTQYCGGVLVTDRHVLTAAHCVYSFRPRDVNVRLGEYDFASAEESRALDFAVSEIRVHPDFDVGSYENDVALVKLHRPTVFDSYVWPVCLPPMGQTFENRSAIVTGWGTSYYGGPASTVLMEVEVPVWPQDKCAKSFVQRIPSTTMCAGGYEGGRDACQGDSGGPLLHQLANGRWVNIGIVSWGIRCGDPQKPGVYTRVSSYLDWIFRNAVF